MAEQSDDRAEQDEVLLLEGSTANLSMLAAEIAAADIKGVAVGPLTKLPAADARLDSGILSQLLISITGGSSPILLDRLISAAQARGKIHKWVRRKPGDDVPTSDTEPGDGKPTSTTE